MWGNYKNSKTQKCSHWDHGGSLCFQTQESSQKAIVYHCQKPPVGWVGPQVLLAPCVLVHAQSSTDQELSIFLKPISGQTLGPSCYHFYFSLNPGRQELQLCKVADVQLSQACQEPESEVSLAPTSKQGRQNRQSFSCRCENSKASGLIQS